MFGGCFFGLGKAACYLIFSTIHKGRLIKNSFFSSGHFPLGCTPPASTEDKLQISSEKT
jgi:hypothetical protein